MVNSKLSEMLDKFFPDTDWTFRDSDNYKSATTGSGLLKIRIGYWTISDECTVSVHIERGAINTTIYHASEPIKKAIPALRVVLEQLYSDIHSIL